MTAGPDRYAVIGNPVDHSRSPAIHAAFAEQTGQTMTYTRLPAAADAFIATADRFFADGGQGLNVTLPFKQAAATYAATLSARAERAGAVNTLIRCDDGSVHGDNTDGVGLLRDLTGRLGTQIQGRRVLVLGAGGAVRGAVPVLLQQAPQQLHIANRTAERAESIAADFTELGPVDAGGLADIDGGWDLVINAISAGLTGRMPDLPTRAITGAAAAYDMIYADAPTPFLRWAERHGVARRCDGFGMLVEQAAESFHLWRGVRPETRAVIAALHPAPQSRSDTV